MTIDIFTLCDSAQDYNGKMIIVGAFSTLVLNSLPTNYPEFAIAIRIGFEKNESSEHNIEVSIKKIDEEIDLIKPLHAVIPQDNFVNQSFYSNFIIKLNNVSIPSAGEYEMKLKVDGTERITKLNVVNKKQDNK